MRSILSFVAVVSGIIFIHASKIKLPETPTDNSPVEDLPIPGSMHKLPAPAATEALVYVSRRWSIEFQWVLLQGDSSADCSSRVRESSLVQWIQLDNTFGVGGCALRRSVGWLATLGQYR